MIRFTWLQSRIPIIVSLAFLGVMAIILAITGANLVHLYDTTVAKCAGANTCSTVTSQFLQNDRTLQILLDAFTVVLPAILGVFWGAPLIARELETGTWRLCWTQSVTRTRWLATKLAVVGILTMAVAGLFSLMVTWWSSPIDRANMSVYTSFDQRDIVPIGYAALCFTLGIAAGLLLRRTVAAMATTLVVFVAVRLSFNHFLRAKLIAPFMHSYPLNLQTVGFGIQNGGLPELIPNPSSISNSWGVSAQIVNNADTALTHQHLIAVCPTLPNPLAGVGPVHDRISKVAVRVPIIQNNVAECLSKLNSTYHVVVNYQPPSHYWPLQWSELAIYLGGSIVLAAFCLWWTRRTIA